MGSHCQTKEKVCEICGGSNARFGFLLVTCSKCTGTCEHVYCMGGKLKLEVPQDWVCESCLTGTDSMLMESGKKDALVTSSFQEDEAVTRTMRNEKFSFFQLNSKKQKPVNAGKVKFIPHADAIKLSSGTSVTRLLTFKESKALVPSEKLHTHQKQSMDAISVSKNHSDISENKIENSTKKSPLCSRPVDPGGVPRIISEKKPADPCTKEPLTERQSTNTFIPPRKVESSNEKEENELVEKSCTLLPSSLDVSAGICRVAATHLNFRPNGLIDSSFLPQNSLSLHLPESSIRFFVMDNDHSIATLIDSATSKMQHLQKAFAELESQWVVSLDLKWKELEQHFLGLEKSLKRRFHELEDQEKEFENRTMKAQDLLKKKEADIVAKEQASLDKIQEKRGAAVLAIAIARDKHGKASSDDPAVVMDETPQDITISDGNLEGMKSVENEHAGVKSYPQLVKLCKEMDSEGLHKFISDNRKNLAAIRDEIPFALRAAINPASFVLESLGAFYRVEALDMDGKKDSNLLGRRCTCIMLMECLSTLLTSLDLVSASEVITEEVKEQAKEIADEWKPKLDALDLDASNGNSFEAHAFLQLLVTFGIASDFDKEELSRLVPMVSRRRQMAVLCRSLGLSEKMPGVIEVLVNSGRQIDAVNLAFAFELTEQFSPVALLKSHLREARKAVSPSKPGNTSPNVQNEVNKRELTALKAVVKCIKEHKLEEQYPVDTLQKRVLQLEKAKKRVTESANSQRKRPRANGVGIGPHVTNIPPEKTFYPRVAENRYPPQYMYERPYVYPGPNDNHCPPLLGSAAYSHSPGHGNYFANGYQYQNTYLH
ncbi:FRIGIDA-like protein 3 [Humulus lupulus]|uniref:FRIGIDA-like protein 3 n=1 Tax=Humulus lupulus TaxID=3486 RepID=UPI002B41049A|nr:FRIGIDA-like protein 3 [Humulus lupulus]